MLCDDMAVTTGGVLIIDDDADLREALEFFLQRNGYPALTAPDGAQALRLLATGVAPCVILLDLMMPEMDGFVFRDEQRRQLPATMRIPLVVFTARPRDPDVQHRLDAVAVLQKPFDVRLVLEAVQKHCTPSAEC